MIIVQINSVCGIGSTGRIVSDIHSELISKGMNSYVIYGRYEARSCNNAIKVGNQKDFYLHALQTRLFDAHGFSSIKATQQAIRILDELKPDIIHLHNIHGYYLNVELLFFYLKLHPEIKVIWTLHDCWSFTGHCSHFDFSGCRQWENQCYSCPQKKAYPASYFFDNSMSNYNRKRAAFIGVKNLTIVTPSYWLADLVKKSYLKDYPIKVINNGIDLALFSPRESDFRDKHDLVDKFVVMGAASCWSQRKGFDDFITLANQLSDQYKLVMVGLPLDKIKTLPKNIIGIHRTDNPTELAEIYSSADVFFNPTYEDTYPTVNLEAIACGTPVITYKTGGSPESVSAEHGFVVAKGDVGAVVEVVKHLSQQPFAMGKLPINFDKNNFVDEMLALYHL